jgi:hypothetical protein
MIRVAILIAVVFYVTWKKCCAQPSATANLPMATQTAPAPVTQQQPQPLPQPAPVPSAPVYAQLQQPTFNFQKLMAQVLIYTKKGEDILSSSQFFSELLILIPTFIFISFHSISLCLIDFILTPNFCTLVHIAHSDSCTFHITFHF